MKKPFSDMTAKEYLSQAYRIDVRIDAKLEQRSSLWALLTKATGTLSDMPRAASPNPHRMESIIAKMAVLEDDINADIDSLVDLKREVTIKIAAMENPEHKTLLELRYLCFHSWADISVTMGYDERWVYRLHSKALAQFALDYGFLKPKR